MEQAINGRRYKIATAIALLSKLICYYSTTTTTTMTDNSWLYFCSHTELLGTARAFRASDNNNNKAKERKNNGAQTKQQQQELHLNTPNNPMSFNSLCHGICSFFSFKILLHLCPDNDDYDDDDDEQTN